MKRGNINHENCSKDFKNSEVYVDIAVYASDIENYSITQW